MLTIVSIVFVMLFDRRIIKSSQVRQQYVVEPIKEKSLEIIAAKYGTGTEEHELDITDKISGLILNSKLQVVVTNELVGGDPHEGVVKDLNVTYRLNGLEVNKTVKEGQVLKLH